MERARELPKTRSVIAITIGDPAGIGPEVVVKALADAGVAPLADWKIIGDAAVVERACELTGIRLPPNAEICDLQALDPDGWRPGQLSAACGRAALAYIREAVRLCLEGRAQALTTAPVNKEAITLAGEAFTGHTEYIAALCGAPESRMLLAGSRLRVVHVSTHVALRRACELDTARILRTIELGGEAMSRLGFARPRIAVCGLNPHAGEHGLFGDEDVRSILPAVEQARGRGWDCHGPLPGDTVFLRALREEFDLVVAMYHDQGHIPAKLVDFEGTVNVTLGLPIVRTSVDHGTAFDIAGQNVANPANMKAALRLAVRMAGGTHEGQGGTAAA
ncbi:MAG: 4-hydroxythreonine-4-phosphate dehydrogenase PdxA [Bryobacterales bacterium]|nr:4-hydroxythreonine-4-phosphate dehydrogenase PdxA [Bryobacteraceae bacterium]MDW8354752.1 4-hydroxythreonine-4-phosphate dehydrogenase PdxA [Bryobacterales bacterium]